MAGAVYNIPIIDGLGAARQLRVWSPSGSAAGPYNWLQQAVGADQTNPVSAANPLPVALSSALGSPKGFQQIVGLAAATALTVPLLATSAVVQAESVDVRWRDDGTNPTPGVGMLLYAGQERTFANDLVSLRFIQTGGGVATLNVSYY